MYFALASNWRASEASETLSGVYKFENRRNMSVYLFICMYVCGDVGKSGDL